METTSHEVKGELVVTIHIDELSIDVELIRSVNSALDDAEISGASSIVFVFGHGASSPVGGFPSWHLDSAREDMRYFAKWGELIARIFTVKAKTFAAYRGRAGSAALEIGFVADLRMAAPEAGVWLEGLAGGGLPGMSWYWLPKFVGQGVARRLLLLGGDLTAADAARLGIFDVVDDDFDAAVESMIESSSAITAEAARFTRRILHDSLALERMSAHEQIKAARYKAGSTVLSLKHQAA